MNQVNSVPKSHGMASTSMVLGIPGIFFGWLTIGILPLAAVILGHKSWGRIKRSNGQLQGESKAIAGIVTGYVSLFLSIVLMTFSAVASYREYIVRAHISDAIYASEVYRKAIATELEKGIRPGLINTSPEMIGIDASKSFTAKVVSSIVYDARGVVTIRLNNNNKRLRDAAGTTIVIMPDVVRSPVGWTINIQRSTIPEQYVSRRWLDR